MTYESQRIAYAYFFSALLLFGLQIAFGFLSLAKYLGPDPLIDALNFATSKEIHTNLLLVWLITGFMGAAYFIVPEESRIEIWSTRLAYLQLALWLTIGVVTIDRYLFGVTEGRKLLEMPLLLKLGVVVVMLMFLVNLVMTIRSAGRFTTTEGILVGGLASTALLFVPALIHFDNYTLDRFYRWWVVHLWVEGVWELDTRRHARVPVDPALRRRPRGDGKVALRDRRADVPVRHPRHRAPLLLDRRAALLAVDRRRVLRARASGVSRHDGLRVRHLPPLRPQPPEYARSPLDDRLGGVLDARRRHPRPRTHLAAGESLDARHAHHDHARTHGVLRRLRDDHARHDHVRAAGAHRGERSRSARRVSASPPSG